MTDMLSTDGTLAPHSYFRAAGAAAPVSARDAARDIALTLHDDLAAAESDWRAFQDSADCTVFQTFEWLSCWQRHIGAANRVVPCIVMGRDVHGRLLFILPLAVSRKGFGRELTWLGAGLCDYNAPLLAAEFSQHAAPADFKNLWARILHFVASEPRFRFDMVRLEKMPAHVGAQANPMLALPATLHPSGAYATALTQSWDAFYTAKRSSSTRRRDRSKRNRLAEFGVVKFTTPDDRDGILGAMTALVAQKSAWFAQRGIPDIFARPESVAFYRDFAGDPACRHLAHVSQLAVGAEIAAVNLGLTFRGRYYYVLASYTDGDMSRFGPGAVHLQELFRYATEHGFTDFDFTVGDERYKLDWCDGAQPLYDHLAVTTLRGVFMAVPMRATKWLKRRIKQTPLLWSAFSKGRALAAALLSRRNGK